MIKQKDIPGFEGKYFVTSDGEIYRRYVRKNKLLTGHLYKGKLWIVKLTDHKGVSKEYNYAKIVYETLVHPIPDGYVIFKKNGIKSDNRLINLKVITKEECGKVTGQRSRRKPVELLDDDGVVIDSWKSARAASLALHMSHQSVTNICNKKVKNPMMNLRWERVK